MGKRKHTRPAFDGFEDPRTVDALDVGHAARIAAKLIEEKIAFFYEALPVTVGKDKHESLAVAVAFPNQGRLIEIFHETKN